MLPAYNLVVQLYGLVIRLASLRNAKAAQWTGGRKQWRKKLKEQKSRLQSGRTVWVHCASYGEFEQGRPLMEELKRKDPSLKIILTFFSPSGYEAFHSWPGADVVSYLPLDSRRNARDFIAIAAPDMAIFIKYEFWVNFLFALGRAKVPVYLVSAVFKKHHPFFRWYGGLFRSSLKVFTKIFVQDEPSRTLLSSIGMQNVSVAGDTRFDRVLNIRREWKPFPLVSEFLSGADSVIAGSTWAKDDVIVIDAWKLFADRSVKLIIAPHEPSETAVSAIQELAARAGFTTILYSELKESRTKNADILILNTMGMLSRLYGHGTMAYVGGGFNGGLHNTLEPAVFGLPVTFYKDEYKRYNEAAAMVSLGAAVSVDNAQMLSDFFRTHTDHIRRQEIRGKLEIFFAKNANVTGKLADELLR